MTEIFHILVKIGMLLHRYMYLSKLWISLYVNFTLKWKNCKQHWFSHSSFFLEGYVSVFWNFFLCILCLSKWAHTLRKMCQICHCWSNSYKCEKGERWKCNLSCWYRFGCMSMNSWFIIDRWNTDDNRWLDGCMDRW